MKVEKKYSILNDIIGPVMTGPSSSHTAGPSRIGYMAQQLVEGELKEIKVKFVKGGSFAATYEAQGTDRGFIGGLMGFKPDDEQMVDALEIAKTRGINYSFEVSDFVAYHPNTAKIHLKGKIGECASITGISTGGGMVEILDINGFSVNITGDYYEILVFTEDLKLEDTDIIMVAHTKIDHVEHASVSHKDKHILINVKLSTPINDNIAKTIAEAFPRSTVKTIMPVYAVLSRKNITVPFNNADEMVAFSSRSNTSPGEAGLAYEMARGDMSKGAVMAEMGKIVDVMESSISKGLKSNRPGKIIKACSGNYLNMAENDKLINLGAMDTVVAWTMAMVEVNSYYGIVVAAPTSGACGTVPGAILGVADYLRKNQEEKILALLAAGATGVAIANQATFAAEVCGCQAECGAASAMAASGIIHLMGGTVEQANAAASISLQNVLGMICDSVANTVEVPCLGRNVMCAINAVSSANMVMAGVEQVIPLDEVIISMLHVGKLMPPELCCTNAGGLATTKTSRKLEKIIKKKN